MTINLDHNTPYQWDLPLFKELGLEPFDIPLKKPHEVGTVTFDNGSTAQLTVKCYPAQFWSAEVYCAMTGTTVELEFTSGSLSDCWSVIKAIATAEVVLNHVHDHQDEWYRANAS